MSGVDGLVSGLNTSQIISQLMQVERLPEQQLLTQKSTSQTFLGILQTLNLKAGGLTTAASALVPDPVLKTAPWAAKAASSSDATRASVTADNTAAVGGISFTVTALAAAGAAVTTGTVGATTTPVAAGPFTLTKGTTATTVNVANGATLSDVVSAINSSGAGVTAAAVQVAPGSYRLQLSSTTTGADSNVSISAGAFPPGMSGLGDTQELSAGADTVLHVGTGVGAYDVTSPTTTVAGLLPGVTITALKADPATSVSVQVTADSSGIADKVKALVDQANSVLSFVTDNGKFNPTSKTTGPLFANSLAEGLSRQVQSAVIGTSSSTPALFGVSVQKDGTVGFDRAAFLAAYAKDPAKAEATLTAMSQQIATTAKQASDPTVGLITTQIASVTTSITQVTKSISDFEDRMTLRQASLQKTYSDLEVALGKLQSQSSWLSGQLANLAGSSAPAAK